MSLPAQDVFGLTHPRPDASPRPSPLRRSSITSLSNSMRARRASRDTTPTLSTINAREPEPYSTGVVTRSATRRTTPASDVFGPMNGSPSTKTGVNGHAVRKTTKGAQPNGHTNGLAEPDAKPVVSNAPVVEKIDWEIPRKAFHSSIGFGTAYLYTQRTPPRLIVPVLAAEFVIIAAADCARFRSATFRRVWEACLGSLMRESEKNKINGTIWYLLGVTFVLVVYPLDVAVVSILILSWADTAASTIGRAFGRYTPALPSYIPLTPALPFLPQLRLPFAPRKSLAGFVAAAFTGAAISVCFWGFFSSLGLGNVGLESADDLCWTWQGGAGKCVGAVGARDLSRFVSPAVLARVSELSNVAFDAASEKLTTITASVPLNELPSVSTGGWLGLAAVGAAAGIVTGVAEALDVGGLDDNLTLPIISGACIWAVFSVLRAFSA